jgi:hypothetical protein
MHYDVGTLSLWIGVGVALIVGGIQAAGWRHRALITGLIVLGAFCILAALAAPPLANSLPALAQFMTLAAVSPSSWFALLLFIAALILFSPPTRRPDLHLPDAGNIVREEITALESRLGERIDKGDEKLSAKILGHMQTTQKLAEGAQAVSLQLALDLKKVSDSVDTERSKIHEELQLNEEARLNQINRINADVQKFSERFPTLKLNIAHLLDFALHQSTYMMLEYLIAIAPHSDEGGEPAATNLDGKHFKDNQEYLREVQRNLSGTNRWSDYVNSRPKAKRNTHWRMAC